MCILQEHGAALRLINKQLQGTSKYLKRGCQEDAARPCLVVLSKRTGGNGQTLMHKEVPSEHEEEVLYGAATKHGTNWQRSCGASLTGDIPEPPGCNPVPPALGEPAWAGRLTQMDDVIPSNLTHSGIPWIHFPLTASYHGKEWTDWYFKIIAFLLPWCRHWSLCFWVLKLMEYTNHTVQCLHYNVTHKPHPFQSKCWRVPENLRQFYK